MVVEIMQYLIDGRQGLRQIVRAAEKLQVAVVQRLYSLRQAVDSGAAQVGK